jgi:hypothetical protein
MALVCAKEVKAKAKGRSSSVVQAVKNNSHRCKNPLPDDLLYAKPGSKLTCFTSLCVVRAGGLFHLRDSAQKKVISFLRAGHDL